MKQTRSGETSWTYIEGTLYRQFQGVDGQKHYQLVVPRILRTEVMKLGHETMMAGHLGTRKTTDRIISEFYWPGCKSDIRRFCQSCKPCQLTVPKGRVAKVKLGRMPLMDTPFKRVAVDIIGPIFPASEKGNRFILTMVDYATRYPEAVALPSIETERVAEAIVDMISRVGVPEEVLSDRGSQFTGGMMKEVSRLLSIKSLTTTPYHPQCNGLVEKFNGTLKSMLRKMSAERPKDWDKYLGAVLFAYREVPQESIGFSPFELLYGRTVRGPMTVLRELWSKRSDDSEVQTTYQYVIDLKQRLESTCQLAQDNLRDAAKYYKRYFDSKAKDRKFKVGQRVLVLLPTNHNKLLMKWKGPFPVEQVRNDMDYVVNMRGKAKLFHANMLKAFHERTIDTDEPVIAGAVESVRPGEGAEMQAWAAVFVDVIEETDSDAQTEQVRGKEEEHKQDEIVPLLFPL